MDQKLQKSNYDLSEILMMIIAFTLPFYQQATIIAIILLVVISAYQKKFLELPSTFKKNPLLIFWTSYFLLHLTGLLWSENMKYGWSDIETKLSFLIFPVVLGTTLVSTDSFRKIKKAFIAGNIIACICCLMNALINYSHGHDIMVFFYMFYSALIHCTYFTIYLNLALLFLLEESIYHWKNCSVLKKAEYAIGILFIVINIILLSARTAIATCLFTILFYCIIQIMKFKKGAVLLILSLAGVAIINFQITHLFNRYSQVAEVATHLENKNIPIDPSNLNTEGYNSITTRIELWKNAIKVIERNWLLGVGTGDIKEELVKEYKTNNFQFGVENKFNPHNQYLHTGVILGISGIILLLCCLLLPLRLALQQRNWLYVCFLIIIILNAITESILERQNGIIFYAFFNVLFYIQSINNSRNEFA